MTTKVITPFSFVTSVSYTKEYMMLFPDLDEKNYVPFVTNRSLSYFSDCIFAANEMNRNYHIDNKLQYDFFFHLLRKRKRFSKWDTADDIKQLDSIKKYFRVNNQRAREYANLLTQDQIKEIHRKVNMGGRKS